MENDISGNNEVGNFDLDTAHASNEKGEPSNEKGEPQMITEPSIWS